MRGSRMALGAFLALFGALLAKTGAIGDPAMAGPTNTAPVGGETSPLEKASQWHGPRNASAWKATDFANYQPSIHSHLANASRAIVEERASLSAWGNLAEWQASLAMVTSICTPQTQNFNGRLAQDLLPPSPDFTVASQELLASQELFFSSAIQRFEGCGAQAKATAKRWLSACQHLRRVSHQTQHAMMGSLCRAASQRLGNAAELNASLARAMRRSATLVGKSFMWEHTASWQSTSARSLEGSYSDGSSETEQLMRQWQANRQFAGQLAEQVLSVVRERSNPLGNVFTAERTQLLKDQFARWHAGGGAPASQSTWRSVARPSHPAWRRTMPGRLDIDMNTLGDGEPSINKSAVDPAMPSREQKPEANPLFVTAKSAAGRLGSAAQDSWRHAARAAAPLLGKAEAHATSLRDAMDALTSPTQQRQESELPSSGSPSEETWRPKSQRLAIPEFSPLGQYERSKSSWHGCYDASEALNVSELEPFESLSMRDLANQCLQGAISNYQASEGTMIDRAMIREAKSLMGRIDPSEHVNWE